VKIPEDGKGASVFLQIFLGRQDARKMPLGVRGRLEGRLFGLAARKTVKDGSGRGMIDRGIIRATVVVRRH
jgi:hypothetical protein